MNSKFLETSEQQSNAKRLKLEEGKELQALFL